MRNVLIVEDKQIHREALFKIVSNINQEVRVFLADTVGDAYRIAMEHHIHLFLVDIILQPQIMGDVSGLQYVQEIRNIKKYEFTPIIFITSLEDPKLYSYSQLHCFGYIEKPFSVEQVSKLVAKALEFPMFKEEDKYVYFRKDGIIYSKCIEEIIYIESSRRKIVVHCKNDVLEIPYKTCDGILEELDSENFVKCSRFTIVNKKFIREIDYGNRYLKLRGIAKPIEIGMIMKKQMGKLL